MSVERSLSTNTSSLLPLHDDPMDSEDSHGRCVTRETEDGSILITDTENSDAWIRCDSTVAISWQT